MCRVIDQLVLLHMRQSTQRWYSCYSTSVKSHISLDPTDFSETPVTRLMPGRMGWGDKSQMGQVGAISKKTETTELKKKKMWREKKKINMTWHTCCLESNLVQAADLVGKIQVTWNKINNYNLGEKKTYFLESPGKLIKNRAKLTVIIFVSIDIFKMWVFYKNFRSATRKKALMWEQ